MFGSTISRCSQFIFTFSGKPNSITTTPNNDEFNRWNWELSFTVRLVINIIVLGTIMIVIFLILKYLSDYDLEPETERLPVVEGDETPFLDGPSEITKNEDIETASFSSAEDVDYSTLCVICFEERRNCFFVPCGHSATCKGCARKILSEESKVCPICRRVIRKAKRFLKL